MAGNETNALTEFMDAGGDVTSAEGQRILADTHPKQIKETAFNGDHADKLLAATGKLSNMFARRNLDQALQR